MKVKEVIVTSYDMGVSHYGGFSEYARVNSDWVVKLPDNMTLEAMIYEFLSRLYSRFSY